MNIKIADDVFTITNDIKEIEPLFESINKRIEEAQLQLLYFIIDGERVNNEYYTYFQQHIETIKEVEVVCDSLKSLVNETVLSANQYIKNAIPAVQNLTEAFYQSADNKSFNNLADLFEGIQWLTNTQERIDQIKNLESIIINYPLWNEYVQSIKKIGLVLPELEEGLKQHDNILIGDILLYEIVPIFQESEEKLRLLIPVEGNTHVS